MIISSLIVIDILNVVATSTLKDLHSIKISFLLHINMATDLIVELNLHMLTISFAYCFLSDFPSCQLRIRAVVESAGRIKIENWNLLTRTLLLL